MGGEERCVERVDGQGGRGRGVGEAVIVLQLS